jgi:hypothetical protein
MSTVEDPATDAESVAVRPADGRAMDATSSAPNARPARRPGSLMADRSFGATISESMSLSLSFPTWFDVER